MENKRFKRVFGAGLGLGVDGQGRDCCDCECVNPRNGEMERVLKPASVPTPTPGPRPVLLPASVSYRRLCYQGNGQNGTKTDK